MRRFITVSFSATGSTPARAATRRRWMGRCTATTSRPRLWRTLCPATTEGFEPLRRYPRLRRRVLGVASNRLFDVFVPLVEHSAKYPYDDVGAWIVDSVAPLGGTYQHNVNSAFQGRWIDV